MTLLLWWQHQYKLNLVFLTSKCIIIMEIFCFNMNTLTFEPEYRHRIFHCREDITTRQEVITLQVDFVFGREPFSLSLLQSFSQHLWTTIPKDSFPMTIQQKAVTIPKQSGSGLTFSKGILVRCQQWRNVFCFE